MRHFYAHCFSWDLEVFFAFFVSFAATLIKLLFTMVSTAKTDGITLLRSHMKMSKKRLNLVFNSCTETMLRVQSKCVITELSRSPKDIFNTSWTSKILLYNTVQKSFLRM